MKWIKKFEGLKEDNLTSDIGHYYVEAGEDIMSYKILVWI